MSSSTTCRHASANRKREQDAEASRLGVSAVGFRVHRVSAAASVRGASALSEYSRRSCWESYARETESIVLALWVIVECRRGGDLWH
jgi:hypothetical protein